MLKGDLSSFSLGEIFQSLAINNHTGTLKITSPDHTVKLIYFVQGDIHRFSHGVPEELRIGEVLVRLGNIAVEDLEEAYAREQRKGTSVGMSLLKKGLITKEDVVAALKTTIQEEIYTLFLSDAGDFEFAIDDCPDELFDDLQKNASVSINTNSVIMEGLRRIDEWSLIHTKIATFDEIFARTDIRPDELEELDAAFLDKIDAVRPVSELFKEYYGTQFELCKLLLDCLDAGLVRFLTSDECVEGATQRTRHKQYKVAAHYLRFATQLKPDEPIFQRNLAEALAGCYQEEGSREAYAHAAQLYYNQGDLKEVAAIGETLTPVLHHLTLREIDVLFNAYLQLEDAKKAILVGNQLASLLQKEGEFDRAAETLEAVVELNPDDLNLLIEIGTLFQKSEDFDRSTTCFESVADSLEKDKKYRELLKILRLLQRLHPKSVELKQRVSATHALIKRIEQKKKRRVTTAGIASIVLVVISVVPIVYEIKAREFFNYAHRMEQISMVSTDFTKAKQAYEELLKSFSFSTKIADAEVALERISQIEKEHISNLREDIPKVAPKQIEREREERHARFTARLRQARETQSAGNFKAANRLFRDVLREFPSVPESRTIQLPLRITAHPKNSDVTIFVTTTSHAVEKVIKTTKGRSPYVHHYRPGDILDISLSRSGYETIRKQINLNDQFEIHFELDRKPIGSFQPTVGSHQNVTSSRGRLIFPSRDGYLYAIDPKKGSVQWKRIIGRFGDRPSDVSAHHDEIYISTIVGEVTAISTLNGKSRWIAKVGEPVYGAPATSTNGKWLAVGTIRGSIVLIDNESGKIVDRFSAENGIVATPLMTNDWIIVGSKDNSVYFYSIRSRKVLYTMDLGADVSLPLTALSGSLLACTDNGIVRRLDLKNRSISWSFELGKRPTTPILLSKAGAHIGTTEGRLVTFDPKNGRMTHERVLGNRPLAGAMLHEGVLYVTVTNGDLFALDPSSNATLWSFSSGVPTLCAPIALDGKLYMNNANGRFLVFEILE